jgi:tetratricopeptide (TPR) repeat protein
LPDPQVSVQLAKAHNRLGEMAIAEKVLQETIKTFPHYVEGTFELASFYSGQKQWDKAFALLNRDQPEFHNQRGLVYLNRGDATKAADEFLSAIRSSEIATYWNNLGIAYQRMNRIKLAEEAYFRALQLNPSYAECEANLSFFLISLQRWEEAGEHLEHVTSRNTHLWRARMALGYVREMQGRTADAVEIYKKLLTEAPGAWPERTQVEGRLAKLVH